MAPCGFQMVLCGFPIVLCCLPMVLCHGAASRRSPAQLCGLPYGAVPRRCHQALTSAALRASLWCSFRSGFFFAAASSSVPRSPALQQSLQRSGSLSGAAASSSAQRSREASFAILQLRPGQAAASSPIGYQRPSHAIASSGGDT